MNLSRWKLLAGVFGLAVCGLAALAEPACRTAGHGNSRQLPPVAESKAEPKPKSGSTPAPTPLPALPPAELPKASETVPTPKPLLGEPVELTLPMVKDDKPKGDGLPAFPVQSSPTPNVPGATAVPDALPAALPGLPPVTGTKEPLPTPTAPLPMTGGGLPQPMDTKPLPLSTPTSPLPTPTEAKPLPLPQPMDPKPQPLLPPPTPAPTPPAPTPEVRGVEARATAATVEKRLKVTLQMGDGNPRFEIRDGDEVVLKVVSDKIDVKAPTEKGDLWSTLKASGRVRFQSPGGDGFCDELQISPGTCEVVATGKVQFKYNWGKVETAVTSERMTFRLGAMPGGQ